MTCPPEPSRTIVALLVPADPDQPLGLHLLPDRSVALSDVLGGGLLAEPEVWLLGPEAVPDVRRVHVYRPERRPDGAAPNRRVAALADLLDVPPGAVDPCGTDALLVGGREDGADTDVPTLVLATALHSGWPVQMDVSATGDREAGEPRW